MSWGEEWGGGHGHQDSWKLPRWLRCAAKVESLRTGRQELNTWDIQPLEWSWNVYCRPVWFGDTEGISQNSLYLHCSLDKCSKTKKTKLMYCFLFREVSFLREKSMAVRAGPLESDNLAFCPGSSARGSDFSLWLSFLICKIRITAWFH